MSEELLKKGSSVFSVEGKRLIYTYDTETVVIEPWNENSIRVRTYRSGEMPQNDWALSEKIKETDSEISFTEEGDARLKNGKITAHLSRFGKLSFFNQKGEEILREWNRNRRDPFSMDSSALELDAREMKPILGSDAFKVALRFESLDEKEHIYGMGQYQQSHLDLKGLDLELAQRNSQATVPFMISSLGYGFLWNNPAVGRVTFAKNTTTWESAASKIIDYWVTAGDTPAEIEEAYANSVGKAPMMPDFAMGFWQCKLRYQTEEELLNVAREYKRKGIPVSVIVVDFFHWPVQGEWKFDPTYWPHPDAMIKELNDMGMKLMVSVWPTVDYRSENFNEMVQKGYLGRSDKGVQIQLKCQGDVRYFDATNPGAREYVWSKVKKNYYDKGIRVFWLDTAEPEYQGYDFDNYRYYLGSNLQIGNIFPKAYAKGFYEGMEKEGQKDILNLIRCAWAGSQKYGTLVWSGDIHSDFATLRNQYAAGLNMGIAGIPWWTTDIGGFAGGNINDPHFHELLVRWFEYGTFCPVMRLHGERQPAKPQYGTTGGAACVSGADNEIWTYGPEVEKICTKFIFMRERLKPYIKELMEEAHEKGTPVMRPLFYEFPKDEKCYENHLEYMFGSKLLVAPVMYEGEREREVYFPEGAKWKNAWTGEVYEGGTTVKVAAPLDEIPLFYRDDATLPIME